MPRKGDGDARSLAGGSPRLLAQGDCSLPRRGSHGPAAAPRLRRRAAPRLAAHFRRAAGPAVARRPAAGVAGAGHAPAPPRVPVTAVSATPVREPAFQTEPSSAGGGTSPSPTIPEVTAEPRRWNLSWQAAAFGIWLAGVLAVLGSLGIALLRVRWQGRRARPVTDEAWTVVLPPGRG